MLKSLPNCAFGMNEASRDDTKRVCSSQKMDLSVYFKHSRLVDIEANSTNSSVIVGIRKEEATFVHTKLVTGTIKMRNWSCWQSIIHSLLVLCKLTQRKRKREIVETWDWEIRKKDFWLLSEQQQQLKHFLERFFLLSIDDGIRQLNNSWGWILSEFFLHF